MAPVTVPVTRIGGANRNAPILMTTPGALNADTAAALTTLGAKTIYVIGGNGSVPQAIRTGLKSVSYTLVELGGADRYATNLQAANYLVTTEKLEMLCFKI